MDDYFCLIPKDADLLNENLMVSKMSEVNGLFDDKYRKFRKRYGIINKMIIRNWSVSWRFPFIHKPQDLQDLFRMPYYLKDSKRPTISQPRTHEK